MAQLSSSLLSPPSLSLWFIMVLVCFVLLTFNQHFAEVLEPTAKASTVNLLEMQILGLTLEVLDQKNSRSGSQDLWFKEPSKGSDEHSSLSQLREGSASPIIIP